MQVIKKKTATLLSSCTEIGAISADAPQELVLKCRKSVSYTHLDVYKRQLLHRIVDK